MITSLDEVYKQPGEIIVVTMDFSKIVSSEDTISSATVESTPSGLTISGLEIAGTDINITVADGIAGVNYRVQITINLNDGKVFIGDGPLKVRDR